MMQDALFDMMIICLFEMIWLSFRYDDTRTVIMKWEEISDPLAYDQNDSHFLGITIWNRCPFNTHFLKKNIWKRTAIFCKESVYRNECQPRKKHIKLLSFQTDRRFLKNFLLRGDYGRLEPFRTIVSSSDTVISP